MSFGFYMMAVPNDLLSEIKSSCSTEAEARKWVANKFYEEETDCPLGNCLCNWLRYADKDGDFKEVWNFGACFNEEESEMLLAFQEKGKVLYDYTDEGAFEVELDLDWAIPVIIESYRKRLCNIYREKRYKYHELEDYLDDNLLIMDLIQDFARRRCEYLESRDSLRDITVLTRDTYDDAILELLWLAQHNERDKYKYLVYYNS